MDLDCGCQTLSTILLQRFPIFIAFITIFLTSVIILVIIVVVIVFRHLNFYHYHLLFVMIIILINSFTFNDDCILLIVLFKGSQKM